MRELPILCTLDGATLAQRQAELSSQLFRDARSSDPLPDARRWRFASSVDILARLAAMIEAERQCCRFLRFAIDAQPDLGEITLDVTGPAGTREFLDNWR